MIKQTLIVSAFAVMLSSSLARGHEVNTRLEQAMKAIAQDVSAVAKPTTATNPLFVSNDTIVMGITRARTADSVLKLLLQRHGSIQNGVLVEDEFTVPGLDDLPVENAQVKLDEFTAFFSKAAADVQNCEQLLEVELAKPTNERSFRTLKAALPNLDYQP